MIETERVLFAGRPGNQRVRVWLEPHGGAIRILSHDIGSGLEPAFGKDEIEAFLEIEAAHVPNLAAALRAERSDPRRRWMPSSCWSTSTAATRRPPARSAHG